MLVETARAFVRRWPLTLLALLLAAGAAAGAFLAVPAVQQSSAQVLFLPPINQAGIPGEVNPFLSLGGSMGTTASIAQVRVSDQTTRDRLAAQGHSAVYTVAPNLGENAGPILIITAEGRDAQNVQSTVGAVVEEIRTQIQALQAEAQAPSGSLITTTVLTAFPEPVASHTGQLRVGGVLGAVVLALLAVALLLVDRRRLRSSADQAVGEHAPPGQHARPPDPVPPVNHALPAPPAVGHDAETPQQPQAGPATAAPPAEHVRPPGPPPERAVPERAVPEPAVPEPAAPAERRRRGPRRVRSGRPDPAAPRP